MQGVWGMNDLSHALAEDCGHSNRLCRHAACDDVEIALLTCPWPSCPQPHKAPMCLLLHETWSAADKGPSQHLKPNLRVRFNRK